MTSGDPRAALEEAVRHSLRALMTRAVVFNHEVAERTGLNLTDLQCLGLLQLHGPMSAGALARGTGLTTSATTAAIDRLERSGYASREHDSADRRRVIVRLDEKQLEDKILPLYAAKAAGNNDVLARFGDEELTIVRDFLRALEQASATPPGTPG
jgi:DNA-binding MarR family transcriptional regulator